MWRTNANTIEWGRVRSGPECFSTGLYDIETVAGRDVLFWGAKHTELPNRAESGGLPRRRSRRGKANSNSSSFWSSRNTSRASVIWRTALKVSTSSSSCTNTKCSGRTAMSWAFWCTVWGNGHHGKVVLLRCFLLLPYHHVLQAGVYGVFCALHHMWKAWRKQGKKKVLVHGLLQRAPRLVGELAWFSVLLP